MAAGLLTKHDLAGRHCRRLFPDTYVAAAIAIDHRIMCEAALIYLGPRAVISGLSAAYVMGVDVLPLGGHAPEIAVPHGTCRQAAGVTVRRSTVAVADRLPNSRLPTTNPVRTAFDIARHHPMLRAVSAIDAMVHRKLVTEDEIRSYLLTTPYGRNRVLVAGVLAWVDGRAESPMETVLRILIVLGGLPKPVPQVKVYGPDGRFIARVDLAYEIYKIGIEYEGDLHRTPEQFRLDLARMNALQATGWTVVRATIDDIRRPARLLAQIGALLARAERS